MQGAEILFYPTAIGWHPAREGRARRAASIDAWETVQRGHAMANGCYVAVVNRIGHEQPGGGDGIEFWGQSFVAGTAGEILAKASADQEEILVVPVDLAAVDVTRTHWPFLRDRRIDAYGDLTKRLVTRRLRLIERPDGLDHRRGGLIGNYLVQSAPASAPGLAVRGPDSRSRARPAPISPPSAPSFAARTPQLVIHCAALSQSPECEANPALARKLNVEVTALLAELAAEIPLIFLSTDLVFDGRRATTTRARRPIR